MLSCFPPYLVDRLVDQENPVTLELNTIRDLSHQKISLLPSELLVIHISKRFIDSPSSSSLFVETSTEKILNITRCSLRRFLPTAVIPHLNSKIFELRFACIRFYAAWYVHTIVCGVVRAYNRRSCSEIQNSVGLFCGMEGNYSRIYLI
jgi:hypothetical protein